MMLKYSDDRKHELKLRYEQVLHRIANDSKDYSGTRTPKSPLPDLMVVTKFFPASDLAALYDLGIRLVGENRDQEAYSKAAELSEFTGTEDQLRWAFIGQLQTNKAKRVVQYATEIHSVDRSSLVNALGKAYFQQVGRYESGESPAPISYTKGGLKCLIQVNLDENSPHNVGETASNKRGGSSMQEVLQLAEHIESTPWLKCGGVMAVAPLAADPNEAFEKLHEISHHLRKEFPHAEEISAGMSSDLDAAIRWGSTVVRIGSQIMGTRPSQ